MLTSAEAATRMCQEGAKRLASSCATYEDAYGKHPDGDPEFTLHVQRKRSAFQTCCATPKGSKDGGEASGATKREGEVKSGGEEIPRWVSLSHGD